MVVVGLFDAKGCFLFVFWGCFYLGYDFGFVWLFRIKSLFDIGSCRCNGL